MVPGKAGRTMVCGCECEWTGVRVRVTWLAQFQSKLRWRLRFCPLEV